MIVFTQHAEAKLQERRIPKEFVLKTLMHPDLTRQSYGDRAISYKRFGKKYLSVIFKRETRITIVITQYWISKTDIWKSSMTKKQMRSTSS